MRRRVAAIGTGFAKFNFSLNLKSDSPLKPPAQQFENREKDGREPAARLSASACERATSARLGGA
jgi:hypothetical protein